MKKPTTARNVLFSAPVLLLVTALALPHIVLAQGGGGDPTPRVEAPEDWGVEIEVFNTSDTEDDIVALGGSTPCRIRLSTETEQDKTITLVTPPNAVEIRRLSFSHATIPASAEGTLTLGLPKDSSWVPFSIGGALGSQEVGDAAIEAHESNAEGELKGSADVSVYWFHSPFMRLWPGGGSYTFNQTTGTLNTAGTAVNMAAQIMLSPPGLSCDVPPLSNLRVGIVQNVTAPNAFVTVWGNPTWINPIDGDSVTVRSQYRRTRGLLSTTADVRIGFGPTYVPPVPVCEGESNTDDSPSFDSPVTVEASAITNGGAIATIRYTRLVSMNLDADFLDWCVLYNRAIGATNLQQATNPQVESSWSLHVGSGATQQTAQIDTPQSRPVTHSLILTRNPSEFANNAIVTSNVLAGAEVTLPQ